MREDDNSFLQGQVTNVHPAVGDRNMLVSSEIPMSHTFVDLVFFLKTPFSPPRNFSAVDHVFFPVPVAVRGGGGRCIQDSSRKGCEVC